jgi:hypothetical protein
VGRAGGEQRRLVREVVVHGHALDAGAPRDLELAPLLAAAPRDQAAIGEIVARYRLDIDFGTIPLLASRHRLRLA